LTTFWLVGASGMGFAAEGYDLFNIDLVLAILSKEYPDQIDAFGKSLGASSCIVGLVAGMLLFGRLADAMGRRRCALVLSSLQILGSVLSACCNAELGISLASQLALCRFLLGVGIGGEFPVAGAISVEALRSQSFQGHLIGSPFQLFVCNECCVCIGRLLAPTAVLILLSMRLPLDVVWRLALALGSLPGIVGFVLRLLMQDGVDHEDAHATTHAEQIAGSVEESREAPRPRQDPPIRAEVREAPHEWLVLTCGLTWMFFNCVSLGMGCFKSTLAERIFGRLHEDLAIVRRDALYGLSLSTVPLVVSLLLVLIAVDRVSCRLLCLGGCASMAVWNLASAALVGFRPSDAAALPVVLVQHLTFASFPPIFVAVFAVVPINVPAAVRATFTGYASALGKVGGALGTLFFPLLAEACAMEIVMLCCGLVGLAAMVPAAMGFPWQDANPRQLDAEDKARCTVLS